MPKNSFRTGIAAIVVSIIWFCQPIEAKTPPPAEGGQLPEIYLAAPNDTAHQGYLGISSQQTFRIPEIKAEVVIIDLFSMY
jgi:hypothetical protein